MNFFVEILMFKFSTWILWTCIYLVMIKLKSSGSVSCDKKYILSEKVLIWACQLIYVFVHWQFRRSRAWSACHEAAVLSKWRCPSDVCCGGSWWHLFLLLQGFQTSNWCVLRSISKTVLKKRGSQGIKGIEFIQKWKFCHLLLTLMPFQECW